MQAPKPKRNFQVEDDLLIIRNGNGQSIALDITLKKNTFLFRGTQMKYTAIDGKGPSLCKARGHQYVTWSGLLRGIRTLQGEMSFLIIGETMQITYKIGGERTAMHFRFSATPAK